MDAGDLLRLFVELLLEMDGLVTALLDTATELADKGRVDELPPELVKRLSKIRNTPALRPPRIRKPRSRPAKLATAEFPQHGVAQIELERRGSRFRLQIPGRKPAWIFPERAAVIEALAEPLGFSQDKLVEFKTIPELARRIAQLTGAPITNHTVVSSISRLRKWLGNEELIQKRPADGRSGIVTGYRFALLADGKILKHLPDFTATSAATDGDR